MKKPSSAEISPLVQDTQSVCLGSSKDCVASDRGEKGTKPSVPASLHSLSLAKWCANLVTLVFRSRTSFAAFARASIHLPRDSIVSTSPAFPIPLPCVGVFNRMPSGLSARQRAKLHFRRALVLIVLSLNFWWSGNRFIDPNLLKRSPSKQQQQIIARVAAFVRADGPRVPFPLSSVGRRVPKLIARLSELSELLTSAGPGSSPYEKSFEGREALLPADNTVADELEPYRSLDASRLRIVGKGHWDPTEFLSDGLVMAFRNPDCLLFDRSSAAPVPKITDPMPEVVSLAKLWDNYGLLVLHEFDVPTLYPDEQVKVFNCYKDARCDRQIGDRRGRNAYERKVEGPSKVLPAGPDLCEFDFDIRTHRLSVSITDRKDFYHQFRVPFSRAVSNTLGPSIPRAYLESTGAFADLLARKAMPIDRLTCGDQLGSSGRFPKLPRKTADDLFVSFGSILQGDHGGVEYACDSHQGLLQSFNLLQPSTRIAANRPFRGSTMMDGLVIDDYFSVSAVPRDSPETSPDVEAFNTAQLAYEKFSLLGSPTKDVVGESSAKVIGASINASELSRQEGICLLGAPGQKRFTLSWISLQLCTMSFTTDVLHLCLVGGWVSCLGFRRPMMSLLNESFRLVDANTINPNEPRVIRLPRVVANELLLLALLCPLAATDLCARFAPCVFSTDASIEKGAICSAPVPVDFARILWRSSRSKGSYHRLMTPMEALSKNLGIHEELPESSSSYVDRPLAFHYDFIEVFSGASTVTKALDLLGYVVGPPVDLSISPEYDVSFVHVMEWLSFMVSEGLLQSVMVEPPCTTFSIIRRPALRSKLCPFGFNPTFRQTKIGNLLACRALQLMVLCHVNFVAGVLEKPFTSLLKHFPSYQALLGRDGVSQCRTDSCMFGSIHRKSFSFLGVHIDLSNLEVECDRSHTHVPIEGSYTKKSATYTPSLAEALAVTLGVAIDRRRASIQDLDRADMKGLENQLVNAVALRAPWTVDAVWDFKKNSHINILEFSVLERLAKRLASQCSPLRVTCLVDSHVVSAASAKGRTSPKGLGPVLRRFCAISVACGLYFSVPFVPTRLNVADDPTRSVPLRQASGGLCPFDWERNALYDLAMLPKLRRWASNWVRLILSLCGPSVLSWSDRSLFRRRFPVLGRPVAGVPPLSQMDFDCTLGFPGEGPSVAVLTCLLALLTHGALCCTVGFSKVFPMALVSVAVLSSHGSAMRPRNTADLSRQSRRQVQPLAIGRPVLPSTTLNRDSLFAAFTSWCDDQGIDIQFLLESCLSNAEEINAVLSSYGRQLYHSGRPYGHFSETINALVSQRAILRRHLQPAWDVAYAWLRNEPPTHHTACPWQVVLSLLSTALLWGWVREAGIIALCFSGILRVGEGLKAYRRDLLLPSDSLFLNTFALLAIEESKTRFSVARHQCAKIDAPDMLRILTLAFEHLLPNEFLWAFSSQTFRNRFKSLQASIGLPTTVLNGCKPLDGGSLRPGGATWMLQATEDAELVRRRGRWTTTKVLEVYLQETACIRFFDWFAPRCSTECFIFGLQLSRDSLES